MRRILEVPVEEVIPSISAVLEGQGIPRSVRPNGQITQLAEDAISICNEKLRPVGILMDIGKDEFKTLFDGEGQNEDESPVDPIYRASDNLALFAITLGETVCRDISRLFKENDFALGSMLDSAASESAEMTAQVVENICRRHLRESGAFDNHQGTLRFSPGFCGWHISGQKKLFNSLRPGEIGITLNESYLMQPIKSISGVVISGSKHIFQFDDVFSFCRDCATHACRDRIESLHDQ